MERVKCAADAELDRLTQQSAERKNRIIRKITESITKLTESIVWLGDFAVGAKQAWEEWLQENESLEAAKIEKVVDEAISKSIPLVKASALFIKNLEEAEEKKKVILQQQSTIDDWQKKLELAGSARELDTMMASLASKCREVEGHLLKVIFPPKASTDPAQENAAPEMIFPEIDMPVTEPAARDEERAVSAKKTRLHVVPPKEKRDERREPTLLSLPFNNLAVRAVEAADTDRPHMLASLSLALLPQSPGGAWHAARAARDCGYKTAGEHVIKAFAMGYANASREEILGAIQESYMAGADDFHGSESAGGLITVAACLRPAFICPDNDIVTLLNSVTIPHNMNVTHSLITEVKEFASRKVPLDKEPLLLFLEADELANSKAKALQEIRKIAEHKLHLSQKYVPALRVMTDWLAGKGLIGASLGPILSGTFDRDKINAFYQNMLDTSYIEHIMGVTVARLFTEKRNMDIERHAKKEIVEFCKDTGIAVKNFLDICDAIEDSNMPYFVEQMLKSRNDILNLIPKSLDEILAVSGDIPTMAAAAACRVALERLPEVLHGNYKPVADPLRWKATSVDIGSDARTDQFIATLARAIKESSGYWRKR